MQNALTKSDFMSNTHNNLFPIFLKLEELRLLIIGAGEVGYEKLNTVLSNSPNTRIRIVAKEIKDEVVLMAFQHPNIQIIQSIYQSHFLDECDIIIAAVNDIE